MFSKGLSKLVLAVFVLSVVAIGSGICADMPNQDAKRAEIMAKMSPLSAIRFSKEIGLSDKQQEDIKAIQKQSRESMQGFMTDSRAKREGIGSVARSTDTVAMEKSKARFENISKQLMDMRMTEVDKISALLTPEQKAKLAELSSANMHNSIENMKDKTQKIPVVGKKK